MQTFWCNSVEWALGKQTESSLYDVSGGVDICSGKACSRNIYLVAIVDARKQS